MGTTTAKREAYDELIAVAQERVAQLEKEIAFQRQYLADLEGLRGNTPSERSEPRKKKQSRPIPPKGSIEPGSVTDQIVGLLKERGQTMRAADIARELTARGATTTAKGGMLPMVLSSLFRRKNLFRKVARGQYRLVKNQDATE